MIRAFVAIEIPPAQREKLAAIARQLNALGLDGRAVRPEAIHLTLKFLGPVEESRVESIREALLTAAARSSGPFELRLARLGVFPHLERPRVLWVGVEAGEALARLQSSVESVLGDLGFEPENRSFSPHLTLMRLKSAKNLPALVRHLRDHSATTEAGSFSAGEFHLYQSVLKPSGAEYTKLATFPLEPC